MKTRNSALKFHILFFALFLIGYNATVSVTQKSYAQVVIPPSSAGPDVPRATCVIPCDLPGTGSRLSSALVTSFLTNLIASAQQVQARLRILVDDMVAALLIKIDDIELDTIDWWETMWNYDTLPALQRMVDQLTTVDAEDTRAHMATSDGGNWLEILALKINDVRAHRAMSPPLAENMGGKPMPPVPAPKPDEGAGRAEAINRTMRNLWQRQSFEAALNKKGSLGAAGAAYVERKRYEDYKDIFCNPDDNGGNNDCSAGLVRDPKYFNADTLPSKFIYNMLTIDMNDPRMVTTLDNIRTNLIGSPSADPISEGALKSAEGQETFLNRRAYIAKYAAIQSIPNLIMGQRMPGTRMGVQVQALRKDAGMPVSMVSNNPSYRELLSAFTVDRFGSGFYDVGNIKDSTQIEMEKLKLNAFYLMQLRDYYELLERTALTLAVQVSLMADEIPVSNAVNSVPLK